MKNALFSNGMIVKKDGVWDLDFIEYRKVELGRRKEMKSYFDKKKRERRYKKTNGLFFSQA